MTVTVHPGMKITTKSNQGHLRDAYGTLGFLAIDVGSDPGLGPKYLVTNSHVLASPSFDPQVDDEVFCAESGTVVGRLKAWTKLDSGSILTSDVAIAELLDGVAYTNDTPFIGRITGRSHHLAVGNMIYTYGAKTKEFRSKQILSTFDQGMASVNFTSDPRDVFQIAGLFVCEDYGQPGDSGSPLLNRWGRLVGIHVAGRKIGNEQQSLASSIKSVFVAIDHLARKKLMVWGGIDNNLDLEAPEYFRSATSSYLRHEYGD